MIICILIIPIQARYRTLEPLDCSLASPLLDIYPVLLLPSFTLICSSPISDSVSFSHPTPMSCQNQSRHSWQQSGFLFHSIFHLPFASWPSPLHHIYQSIRQDLLPCFILHLLISSSLILQALSYQISLSQYLPLLLSGPGLEHKHLFFLEALHAFCLSNLPNKNLPPPLPPS